MSELAGRRGLDGRRLVIRTLDEKMEPDICTGILYRDPVPLNTSYRNIVRVEDVDHEFLLRASFIHFKRKRKSRYCWNRRKSCNASHRCRPGELDKSRSVESCASGLSTVRQPDTRAWLDSMTHSRYAGGRVEVRCDIPCRVGTFRSESNGEDDIARDSDVSSHDARF